MKQAGFTIAETLITLIVTSFLFLISSQILHVNTSDYELKLVTDDFLTKIEYAQNRAIITGEGILVKVRQSPGKDDILFLVERGGENHTIKQLSIPEGISYTNFREFWVKGETGYIQPLTINFRTEKWTRKITFQMGMGRHKVEDIKR